MDSNIKKKMISYESTQLADHEIFSRKNSKKGNECKHLTILSMSQNTILKGTRSSRRFTW